MKNLFNRLNDRQKKSAKIIAAMLIVAVVLFAVLHVLPKPKTNNSEKYETSSETSTPKESSKKNDDKKNQTSKKDDKKDNKQSDKKDSKKDDKKEDKKEDTSTTSETPTTGTTSTETQNNNTGSSVTNTPTTNTTPSQPEPQPIYQTIHHEEVGHWETQVVQEAWDEPIYERKIIGNQTGTVYNSLDEWGNSEDGSYHVGDVQVGTTHHDAVTQQVWVVDQYAWDETVIVGYR